MGIKDLDKVLDLSISKIESKNLPMEILNKFGGSGIKNHNCHIDFSLLLHKFIMVNKNMNNVISSIYIFLNTLCRNNKVIIYLDPEINIRKQILQEYRNKNKIKQIEIKKKIILDQNDIKYKNYVLDLINTTEQIKVEYNNYKNILENYKENNFIFIDDIKDDKDIQYLNRIRKIQKEIFTLFIYMYDFKHHHRFILNYIQEKFPQITIINSEYLDAELNIVDNIIKNNISKNILFSSDQDIVLFSLYKMNNNYIYIKKNFNILTDSIVLYEKNNFNINLSILVLFFNKSDYFKGIYKFNITNNKIKKLIQNHIISLNLLNLNYKSIKILIATFLQFFVKTPIFYQNTLTCNYIDLYFNEIEKYLNNSKPFYMTQGNVLDKIITLPDIFYYLSTKQILYKTCINNKIIKTNWNF